MKNPNKTLLVATILLALNTFAQTSEETQALDQINFSFAGDDSRIGIGITEEGEFIADFLKSFNSTYRSNWMTQGWYSDGAGGLELDYHWVKAENEQYLIDNDGGYKVNKVFLAIDQNTFNDRKISIGGGQEINDKFWNINLSKGITDERLVSNVSEFGYNVLTGNINGVDYIQNQTIETITRSFEHAYDWGIGGRIGKYFDANLVRLTGGLDYENGDFSSSQLTASVDLEKYFHNTGHSLALSLRQLRKSGDFEVDKDESRAYLMYRYDFGKTFRAIKRFEETKVVDEVALAVLKENNKVVIQNEIDLSSMAFFNLDSAVLRDDTISVLKEVANNIKSKKLGSKINIVGHTCAMGGTKHNQELSEKRAKAAQDFFISQGIDFEILVSSGKGKNEPAFDNMGPDMEKNRRVAISFLTIETDYQEAKIAANDVPVKWVKQPVKTTPSWLVRALRSPLKHKRTVDVYKYEEQEQIETLGDVVFLNQAPNAENDSYKVLRNSSGTLIDILSNDSDLDDDTLIITSVDQPINGTVVNNGSSITYVPNNGFAGVDAFTYIVDDGNGDQAIAIVTITVSNNLPAAVNDTATTVGVQPVTINVIVNDSDSDGTTLIVKSVTQGQNGTVTNNEDGTITFVANQGFVGTDTFTYIVSDADGDQSTATVTIIVEEEAVNLPPEAVDDMYVIGINQWLDFAPLENDSDPDGDAISIVSVDTSSLTGTLTVNDDGTMHYQSQFMFEGNDIFTYTITDGDGETSTATVTICVND